MVYGLAVQLSLGWELASCNNHEDNCCLCTGFVLCAPVLARAAMPAPACFFPGQASLVMLWSSCIRMASLCDLHADARGQRRYARAGRADHAST